MEFFDAAHNFYTYLLNITCLRYNLQHLPASVFTAGVETWLGSACSHGVIMIDIAINVESMQ